MKLNLRFSRVRRALSMRCATDEIREPSAVITGCMRGGFELSVCASISTKQCDRGHRAGSQDGRHSNCQHGSGARKKALFEPGDTRQQRKGEASACFVTTGIASSRALPTSSAGYWSPFLTCVKQAPPRRRIPSGVFFCAEEVSKSVFLLTCWRKQTRCYRDL
jgi:hypothetical protein